MIQLSGTLKTPGGAALKNASVRLQALATNGSVLRGVADGFITDAAGDYAIDLAYGMYSVTVQIGHNWPERVGTITVAAETTANTLNELLV